MTAWPMMPGVPAAGHVTSGGGWHPGRIDGCAKCPDPELPRCPVLYDGKVIGSATTERGAIACAARVPGGPRPPALAAVRERQRPDGSWAWVVGPRQARR